MDESNCAVDDTTIMLRSGKEVRSSLICNDKCEAPYCEDEANCNGLTYGIYCKYTYDYGLFSPNRYIPPMMICNDKADCDNGEDEMKCAVTKSVKDICKHRLKGTEVPVLNFTRCGVTDVTEYGWSLYCKDEDLKKYQTNCTDHSRVGGTCHVNGYLSTVSKYEICSDKNVSICDDNMETQCQDISKSCVNIHKHAMCDNINDCEDGSDENHVTCHTLSEGTCKRTMGNSGDLRIPIKWINDGTQDCLDGIDEQDEWQTCGIGKTHRIVTNNNTCENVFLCLWGDPGFVELNNLCDGLETCGNENKVCTTSQNSKALSTSVVSIGNGLVKRLSICLEGLASIAILARDYCIRQDLIFPNEQYFGVDIKTELLLPNSVQSCDHMYGEQYIFTSCTKRCRNSTCPLKNLPRYEVCPDQYPDRIGTIANFNYLVFFTKSRGNIYSNRYFVCDNKIKCIDYSKVCDLVDDCGDASDERTCTNHFNCSSSGRLIPKTSVCDGHYNCMDLSDECNGQCSKEILEGPFLKLISMIIGGLAVFANIIIIIKNLTTLKHCKTSVALFNKSLIVLITSGDFFVGCYLISISIYDTIIFRKGYCREQIAWMTGLRCSTIGILSTVGSQISLFAMAGLSTIRLNGIKGSLRIPGEVNLINCLKVVLGVLFIVLISVAIAILPIIGAFEDFFVNGIKFSDELKIFIGTTNKKKILAVLEAYYGRMKDTTLSWEIILEMVSNMFSHDKRYDDYTDKTTKLDFYGNDGVCLFKYFVNRDDPQIKFVWAILVVNFVCFLFISAAYILVGVISRDSSKSLINSQSKKQFNKRNRKMNRRITIIISTDFCCWVPFIIICALHLLEVLDATPWYSIFSMIILPINSIINPFLYDDVFLAILKSPCRSIYTAFFNSEIYQSFSAYLGTACSHIRTMKINPEEANRASDGQCSDVDTPSNVGQESLDLKSRLENGRRGMIASKDKGLKAKARDVIVEVHYDQ